MRRTVVWMPEQGRAGLVELAPLNNDHLAPDPDTEREVFILVGGPRSASDTHADLHWGLGWEVSNGAWRHISVDAHYNETDPAPQPRFVYWGAQTKTEVLAAGEVMRFSLGRMTRAQRQAVENLAWGVDVAEPNGTWNCQHWIKALLLRILEAGLITQRTWDNALASAINAWSDQLKKESEENFMMMM